MMKKYMITKPIVLGFLTSQDQYDAIIKPEDGVTLESDSHTIWTIKNGKRNKSITMANAIDVWLKDGLITEIREEKQ